MGRILLVFTAIVALFSITPTSAQMKRECTQAEMDQMQARMNTMSDKKKQNMAMKEMRMASDMMKKKDMRGCAMHLDKAGKAIGKKA